MTAASARSDWCKALGDGTYDATIFGWINSGVGVSSVPQMFKSGGGTNFNKFTDPAADKLMDQLIVTTDKGKQDGLVHSDRQDGLGPPSTDCRCSSR